MNESAPESRDDVAWELFAHGLLTQRAEDERSGAKFRREARVRAILEELDAPPAKQRTPRNEARSIWLRLSGLVAAVLATVAMWFAWPSHRTPAYAEMLIERAVLSATNEVHVFRVEVDKTFEPRRSRHRRSRRRGPYRMQATWLAALGTDRRWNVRKVDGSQLVFDGTEIGSDGKSVWVKAPNGHAFELFMNPRDIEVANLSHVMSYYELRPFLETLLKELDVRLLERRDGTVRFGGSYTREPMPARAWHKRHRHHKAWMRHHLLGTTGEIDFRIDEQSGRLLQLTLEQKGRYPGSVHIVRQDTPKDLAAAGFLFDPPRVRVSPSWKFWAWAGLLGKAWRRIARQKKRQK